MKIKQQAVQNLAVKTQVQAGDCCDPLNCQFGLPMVLLERCYDKDDDACATIGYTITNPIMDGRCPTGACGRPWY